jgi:hypothetical protein
MMAEKIKSRTVAGIALTLVWLIGFGLLTLLWEPPTKGNEWGDWAAGMFAPVAFFWLVLGYYQQGEELRENVKALKLQEAQLKQQASELNESVKQQSALVAATTRQADLLTESLSIAKQSAAAAVAAQRPWLGLKVDIGGELKIGERVVEIPLSIAFTNVGNSPAINAMPWVAATPCAVGGESIPFSETLAAARDVADRMARVGTGETLFPNQSHGNVYIQTIHRAEFDEAIAHGKHGKMMYFHISVCLDYKFANGGGGRTEKSFILWGVDQDTGGFGHIDSSLAIVPRAELRLQQLPIFGELT